MACRVMTDILEIWKAWTMFVRHIEVCPVDTILYLKRPVGTKGFLYELWHLLEPEKYISLPYKQLELLK